MCSLHISQQLQDLAKQVERHIKTLVTTTSNSANFQNHTLHTALCSALLSEHAKRIRAFMLVQFYFLARYDVEGTHLNFDTIALPQSVLTVAAAIEMVHAASLVHDDLPAMDDADYRRHQLSCHKEYGEGIAILVGDALLTLTFECLASLTSLAQEQQIYKDPSINKWATCVAPLDILEIIRIIAHAAGAYGMCGGQAVDLLHSKPETLNLQDFLVMQQAKTGCMFAAACESGAILGGASQTLRTQASQYGYAFGALFQALDDLKDNNSPLSRNEAMRLSLVSYFKDSSQDIQEVINHIVEQLNVILNTLPGATTNLRSLLSMMLQPS